MEFNYLRIIFSFTLISKGSHRILLALDLANRSFGFIWDRVNFGSTRFGLVLGWLIFGSV